ncbi:MAG TPA: hypothetical protein VJ482_07615 [Acidimicrobiia bacterium]|nr:hypothetical protein [Acidimicrobiia bacterium]
MELDVNWIWAGRCDHVVFVPVGEQPSRFVDWVGSVTALLPDGTEIEPTRFDDVRMDAAAVTGTAVRFDPHLPAGSVVLVNGELLYTV